MTTLFDRRVQEFMTRLGIDAIIAASPVNVSYFSGFDCWAYRSFREDMNSPGATSNLMQAYVVLTLDGEPTLIIGAGAATFAIDLDIQLRAYGNLPELADCKSRRQTSRYLNLLSALGETQVSAGPGEALIEALRDSNHSPRMIASEPQFMSERTRLILRKAIPNSRLANASEMFKFIRMVKTSEETRRIKTACEINCDAESASLKVAKPGAVTGEMLRAFMVEVANRKGLFEHFIFSPDGVYPTDTQSYKLKAGECLFFDTGCIYNLYNADTGTTFTVGKPKVDVVTNCGRLWDAIEASVDKVRPGSLISSVPNEVNKTLAGQGMRNVSVVMHGIGLEAHEYPLVAPSRYKTISDDIISNEIDFPLEEGVVVNIEASKFDFGKAAYQAERTFVVGRRSTRELTPKRPFPFVTAD